MPTLFLERQEKYRSGMGPRESLPIVRWPTDRNIIQDYCPLVAISLNAICIPHERVMKTLKYSLLIACQGSVHSMWVPATWTTIWFGLLSQNIELANYLKYKYTQIRSAKKPSHLKACSAWLEFMENIDIAN